MANLIPLADVARQLGTPEHELRELATSARLPFCFTSRRGLLISEKDLPLWRHAVQGDEG